MLLQIFLVLWVWYFALTVFAFIRFFYRIMQVRLRPLAIERVTHQVIG